MSSFLCPLFIKKNLSSLVFIYTVDLTLSCEEHVVIVLCKVHLTTSIAFSNDTVVIAPSITVIGIPSNPTSVVFG